TLVPAARRTLVGDTFDPAAPRFALLVCVVWMWVYPLTVAGASVVVDANVPFDQRVLGPAAVGVWVALVSLVWVGARRRVPASFHPGGPVLAGCLCVALVPLTWGRLTAIDEAHRAAVANARLRSSSSPVARLPRSDLVVTNRPGDLYVDAWRPSLLLQSMVDLRTGEPNRQFRSELRAVVQLLRARRGVVVVYGNIAPGGPDLPGALERIGGLREVPTCSPDVRAFTLPAQVAQIDAAQPC
ncbi:MAG: hypothetical protein ACKOYM_07145, partial [Actinomycetes bacterium]